MPSDSSAHETVNFGVFKGVMVIYDVEPSQASSGAKVTYYGNLLGLVKKAVFKDAVGNKKEMAASSINSGRGAISTVPSGLVYGPGITWLEEGEPSKKNTNCLEIDFIPE